MDARPDEEEMEHWSKQSAIPAAVEEASEEGLQGPGHHTVTVALPKPSQGSLAARSMSVAKAMEAYFLPAVDEYQDKMFTPLKLHLY